MTWSRFLIIISNLCLLGLFGYTLYSARKPLCIESTIVERLDVVTSHGLETVSACRLQKHVPFSPYLYEMIPQLESRIQKVESSLAAIGPLMRPVRIEIFLRKPWTFGVLDHSVYLGEQMLASRGHLEKALYKIWYRERQDGTFAGSNLTEEMMTDFLLYLTHGKVEIEDRNFGYKTKIGNARWPHVLKSAKAYCESPWKSSEDYSVCITGKNLEEFLDDNLLQLSLRPLVSAAFIESYKNLSFQEKHEFLGKLSDFLASPHEVLPLLLQNQNSALLVGQEYIKNLKDYIGLSEVTSKVKSIGNLAKYFDKELEGRGFQDPSGEVYFDFVYESHSPVDVKSSVFAELQKISENRSDLQIGMTDGKNVWFLPSKNPLDANLIKGLRSQHRMVEICGHFDFKSVLKYAGLADKLMAVESCGDTKPENIETYLKEGAEGFARNNKKISFVQFHLPSLILKSDLIPLDQNVISLIHDRNLSHPTLQAFGWQDLKFEKASEAYRPRAQVEAIQWFRF